MHTLTHTFTHTQTHTHTHIQTLLTFSSTLKMHRNRILTSSLLLTCIESGAYLKGKSSGFLGRRYC